MAAHLTDDEAAIGQLIESWTSAARAQTEHSQDGEEHALSVLLRDGTKVFRTYVTTERGVERLGSVWTLLDLTPYGRQETWEDPPEGWPQSAPHPWWRRHDEYESGSQESAA